jgi:hypothetical protein
MRPRALSITSADRQVRIIETCSCVSRRTQGQIAQRGTAGALSIECAAKRRFNLGGVLDRLPKDWAGSTPIPPKP